MPRIEVFDPPMCCDSGVCGPEPDEQLSRFSADLDWLTQQGVEARRYNLMHEPAAFTANEYVKRIVDTTEGDGLPVVLLDGQVISEGEYPTRQHLAEVVGLSMPDAAHNAAHAGAACRNPAPENATSDTTANDSADASPIFDERIAELVAIGAAIAANCEPCLKYHHRKAAELGVAHEDMIQAVNVALRVKEQPAKAMVQQAQRLLVPEAAEAAGGCCGGSGASGCC